MSLFQRYPEGSVVHTAFCFTMTTKRVQALCVTNVMRPAQWVTLCLSRKRWSHSEARTGDREGLGMRLRKMGFAEMGFAYYFGFSHFNDTRRQ